MNSHSHFEQGSRNEEIFKTTAPYNNHSQGSAPRWLFVCSAGLLRSPTGAALAIRKGINARSCGSAVDYALIPISANLIMWAEKIIFTNEDNYHESLELFKDKQMLYNLLVVRSLVLDIPDQFNYDNPELIIEFEKQIDWVRDFAGKAHY